MRLQTLSGTLNVITPNTETHPPINPPLQPLVVFKFVLFQTILTLRRKAFVEDVRKIKLRVRSLAVVTSICEDYLAEETCKYYKLVFATELISCNNR